MKRSAFIRHLREHGCELKREGAEHSIWTNPSNRQDQSVPRHRELDNVVVALICKRLEIPRPPG